MKRCYILILSILMVSSLLIASACQPSVSYIYETIPPVTVPETRVQFNTVNQTITTTTNITATTTLTSPTTVTNTTTATNTIAAPITVMATTTTTVTTTIQAKTLVSGVLVTGTTTWGLANSPYALTGNVQVPTGGILIIQAGVVVDLRDKFIQVDGTLQVIGIAGQPVTMSAFGTTDNNNSGIIFTANSTGWDEVLQTGSIIQNAIIQDNIIRINGGAPKITSNTFVATGSALTDNGDALVGIAIWSEGRATIIGNSFKLRMGNGIALWGLGTVKIEHNSFEGRIVNAGNQTGRETIAINLYSQLQTGAIFSNTIFNNNTGLRIALNNAQPFQINITGNAIYNNSLNARVVGSGTGDINMPNNWWGTADAAAIAAKIYDYNQDFRLGKIIYTPFLTSMPTDVPVLPP